MNQAELNIHVGTTVTYIMLVVLGVIVLAALAAAGRAIWNDFVQSKQKPSPLASSSATATSTRHHSVAVENTLCLLCGKPSTTPLCDDHETALSK